MGTIVKNFKYISNLLSGITVSLCVAFNLGQYLNSIKIISNLNISDMVLNFIIAMFVASITHLAQTIYKKKYN